jgi:hypothetical protein
MEIFDIGIFELVLIFILMFLLMGPREMKKAGTNVGRWLNKLVRSETWQTIVDVGRSILYLPNNLMREANLEDGLKDNLGLDTAFDEFDPYTASRQSKPRADEAVDNSILHMGRSREYSADPPPLTEPSDSKRTTQSPTKKKIKKKTSAKAKSKGRKRADA